MHPRRPARPPVQNGNWTVHFQGNTEKDAFMETYFANTSTLWAYHVLNPAIGTAKVVPLSYSPYLASI